MSSRQALQNFIVFFVYNALITNLRNQYEGRVVFRFDAGKNCNYLRRRIFP